MRSLVMIGRLGVCALALAACDKRYDGGGPDGPATRSCAHHEWQGDAGAGWYASQCTGCCKGYGGHAKSDLQGTIEKGACVCR